ncbi:hypothetical protein HAX54_004149, partial [Datura stramonium]|nr:hypothetical protein [Datura stramonium]
SIDKFPNLVPTDTKDGSLSPLATRWTSCGTMPLKGTKKQQEAAVRKEIAKKRQLRDELEWDDPSGHKSGPIILQRSLLHFPCLEREEKGQSYDEDPPKDDSKEGDSAEEEWGEHESVEKESGEQGDNSNPPTIPEASIQEKPRIRIGALSEVPELRRLFDVYNMHWMAKTLVKYSVWNRTPEYDYRIEALKGVKKLRTENKLIHYRWMENIITEAKEDAKWVTSGKPIYKASFNFLAKSWWSIVRHRLAPTVNENVLSDGGLYHVRLFAEHPKDHYRDVGTGRKKTILLSRSRV